MCIHTYIYIYICTKRATSVIARPRHAATKNTTGTNNSYVYVCIVYVCIICMCVYIHVDIYIYIYRSISLSLYIYIYIARAGRSCGKAVLRRSFYVCGAPIQQFNLTFAIHTSQCLSSIYSAIQFIVIICYRRNLNITSTMIIVLLLLLIMIVIIVNSFGNPSLFKLLQFPYSVDIPVNVWRTYGKISERGNPQTT